MGRHGHLPGKAVIAVAAGIVSALLVGCGSATSTTSTRGATAPKASSPAAASPTTATSSTRPGAAITVPADIVAIAAGAPITRPAFNHWINVAAKSQAAQTPGQPSIAPTDPPAFNHCIAQVRQRIPSLAKSRGSVLKADCQKLFTSLSAQVMDFLIKADWYQAEARKLGLTPTAPQVQQAFTTQRKQTFPTQSGFQKFLSQTGQTKSDITFRFKVNLIVTRLIAREKGKQTAREQAVDRLVTRDYRASTLCTPMVKMADCGRPA